jgi:hypothetical protein
VRMLSRRSGHIETREPPTTVVQRGPATPANSRHCGRVYTHPVEIPLRGVYTARTVSSIFTSSALIDHEKRKTGLRSKQLADNSIVGQGPNEAIYCTAQLINTSRERITLHAGTQVADIYDIEEIDLIDDVTESDVTNVPKVLKADRLTLINPSPFCLDNYKMSGTLFIIDYRWVLFKTLYFDIA